MGQELALSLHAIPDDDNDGDAVEARERVTRLMMAYRMEKIMEGGNTRSEERRHQAGVAVAVAEAYLIEHRITKRTIRNSTE